MKNVCSYVNIFFLLTMTSFAQWQKVNDMYGGVAPAALLTRGDTIYAGFWDGVYVSTNNGENWNHWGLRRTAENSSEQYTIASIAVIKNTVFAAQRAGGVLYKTTNEGKEWTRFGNEFDSKIVNRINGLFTINDNIFLSAGSTVFRSSDMGETWKNIISYNMLYGSFVIHNSVLYYYRDDGFYYSEDYGETWNSIKSESLRNTWINCMTVVDTGILIGTNRGILISTDNGKTWGNFVEKIPNIERPLDRDVVQLYRDGEYIFAFRTSYLYRTKDMGKTWEELPVEPPHGNCTAFAANNTKLFVGSGSSIYTSMDKGMTWKKTNKGIEYSSVKSLQSIGEYIVAGTNSGLHISNDNGNTWKLNDTPNGNHTFMNLVLEDGILYGGTEQYSILVSSDKGITWSKTHSDNEFYYPIGLAFAGNNMISIGDNGINVSTDRGKTFTLVQRQNEYNYTRGLVAIDSVLISGGNGGMFILSTDYGMTWNYRSITADPGTWDPYDIISLHASNKNFYVGTSKKGVFRSTDMGNTWINCSKGLSDSNIVGIVYEKNRLFSCGYNGSLHVSFDEGDSWKLVSRDTNIQGAMNLFATNGYLYVGTWWYSTGRQGTWRMKIDEIDISNIDENGIQNSEIQIFPNPGNNIVTVLMKYEGQNPNSYVIHNSLGEEVLSGELSERNNTLDISIDKLPEGVYFFNTHINGRIVQEKFVVMR